MAVLMYKCKIWVRTLEVQLFRLAFCHIHISKLFQDRSPWLTATRRVSKFINSMEVIMVLTYMVPIVSSQHTSVDVTVAMADPAIWPGDTNPRGQLILILGGSSSFNDWAISLKPRGSISGQAPEASTLGSPFTQHTGSGELWEEAEVESSLLPHSSPTRQQQILLWLELQAWQCHLRSTKVEGMCPTEATRWDG